MGLLAVAAMPPQAPSDPPLTEERAVRASPPRRGACLLDAPVLDGGGHALGRLWDLIVAADGSVTALVQSRERGLVGVPLALLEWRPDPARPAAAGRAVLRVSADTLLRSPTLVSDDAVDGEWLRRLHAYYGSAPTTPDADATPGPSAPLSLRRLAGAPADDTAGRPCGEVLDLAVDTAGSRVAYLLLGVGTGGHRGRRVHGVAWPALMPSRHPDRVTLTVSRAELDASPGLDLDPLPRRPDVAVPLARTRTSPREDTP